MIFGAERVTAMRTERPRALEALYLLNFALLFTHEIDSAFWSEWNLFGVPGGVQLFLAVNFLLLLVALVGFRQLLLGARSGLTFSLVLAGAGVTTFFIHAYFLVAGHPQFRLPASLIVLVLILIVSIAQGWLALAAHLRTADHSVSPGRHG
jgi:hypothetical protein